MNWEFHIQDSECRFKRLIALLATHFVLIYVRCLSEKRNMVFFFFLVHLIIKMAFILMPYAGISSTFILQQCGNVLENMLTFVNDYLVFACTL